MFSIISKEHPIRHVDWEAPCWHTIQAWGHRVKGAVRVAGWAAELQASPQGALHGLRGAVTDSLLGQETRVVVVDEVAEDAAVGERHSKVLHLQIQG